MLEAQKRQFAAQISEREKCINSMYEARFRHIESMVNLASSSQVTRLMDVPEKESPARLTMKSFVASGSCILYFIS
jgi:hypothetical protein